MLVHIQIIMRSIMGQVLKDRTGRKLGEIRSEGTREVICDRMGRKLGYYDGKYTYDRMGRKVGQGNLLTSLLTNP